MKKACFLLCTFFYLLTSQLLGQGLVIEGQVTDPNGEGIPGITITVKGSGKGTATDTYGNFRISDLSKGTKTLIFTGVGFNTLEKGVAVSKPKTNLSIELKESTTKLSAVQVVGKSETAEIRQKPYTVSAIDVRPLKVQNLDINQILNTTTGVRIREEGGLGSNFSFSLNGFSGSQVKFFMDGIPMDYFGSSLSLNNIPANLISKIEVYKGVVPVHLGSDALGGAVNITTNNSIKKFLNTSYSVGSFNTHRASLVSRYTFNNGFVVNANGFFNYSNNNYRIAAEVANTETGKVTEQVVERFHDGYQSQTVQLEAGVEDKPYADQLFLGLIASGNHKEIQSGYNLTKVVGEAYTRDLALIPTLKYQKDDLWLKGLSLTLNGTYKYGKSHRLDTSSRQYNWLGEYTVKNLGTTSGEISWYKTRFRFTDNAATAIANVAFHIDERQSLSLNNTYSFYSRVGSDPISPEAVPFSDPNTLKKNVTGISYSLRLLDSRLTSVFFGKMFNLDALTRDEPETDNGELVIIKNSDNSFGYGAAVTYFIVDELQLKTSYEYTYRLPQASEMFGNGLQLLSNPDLQPEQSQNFNMGVLSQQSLGKHQLMVEAGYLHRLPKNLIYQQALGNTSSFENLQSARANIYEADIRYDFNRRLNVQINGTYQNIINNQRYNPQTGGINYLYEARLPNTPFLFGNARMGAMFHNVGPGKISLNWSALFVEAFYLKWPVYGTKETKADIPRQVSHNANLSYSWKDGRYNASFSCTNVFDAVLFDNFMLQKPGRAFNLKLSYFLQ